jgi:hypothetical protein
MQTLTIKLIDKKILGLFVKNPIINKIVIILVKMPK